MIEIKKKNHLVGSRKRMGESGDDEKQKQYL